MTTKAALVGAIAAAGAECEKAYGSITDATATQMITGPRGTRSRLGTLDGNAIQIEHEYAQMAVHFRLKGLVPPSSERRSVFTGRIRRFQDFRDDARAFPRVTVTRPTGAAAKRPV